MRANGGYILEVNEMKKVISSIITIVLFIMLFDFTGSAQETYKFWDFCIVSYDGDETNISLPTEDNRGEPVVRIGEKVFSKTNISTVYIPDEYRWIHTEAFSYCENLVSVRLPETLVVIEPYAFYGCPNLTYLFIPKNMWAIGDCAFGFEQNDSFRAYVYSNSVGEKYCIESEVQYVVIDKEFDLNQDGEVDVVDAMLLFYHVAQKSTLKNGFGDINHDNVIDISDAMILFYFIAKKV